MGGMVPGVSTLWSVVRLSIGGMAPLIVLFQGVCCEGQVLSAGQWRREGFFGKRVS